MILRRYADRDEAGRRLAKLLPDRIAVERRPVILALPRGGVPVAAPIAARYRTELDIVAVRKVGVPGQPELAMGALARIGERVELLRNLDAIAAAEVTEEDFQAVLRAERAELDQRHQQLRGDRPEPELAGRTVIIVDDGLATGTTMLTAIEAVQRSEVAAIAAAVPVASRRAADKVRARVDHLVCPEIPASFHAVGQSYDSFDAVPTGQVRQILDDSRRS